MFNLMMKIIELKNDEELTLEIFKYYGNNRNLQVRIVF